MIGIGITNYGNRNTPALEMIKKYAPKDAKIVTVNMKGIADAKNMCLALLDECDHIFLFDDDCYPTCEGWHLHYITSGINHMSFTFNRKVLKIENGLIHYELPSGCMLYINRKCLDVIGGFDTEYKGYAYEHVDYSVRAFNAGLTPAKFIDVEHSDKLIYSMDQHKEIVSSVDRFTRAKSIPVNRERLISQSNSKEFKPYK